MPTFDASSLIYAWDNYPPSQFPPLWKWMAEQFKSRAFTTPQVAFEEVERHAPDCAKWLREQNTHRVPASNEIVQEAFRIKGLLKIDGDKYHPKGVGENDLLIIATASIHGWQLISNEGRQHQLPNTLSKAKIPTVCDLESVGVLCNDFITLLKGSRQVFGAK